MSYDSPSASLTACFSLASRSSHSRRTRASARAASSSFCRVTSLTRRSNSPPLDDAPSEEEEEYTEPGTASFSFLSTKYRSF